MKKVLSFIGMLFIIASMIVFYFNSETIPKKVIAAIFMIVGFILLIYGLIKRKSV